MTSLGKALLLSLGVITALPVLAYDDLPTLGDSSSSIVSPQEEYQLGRAWLSLLRSQVPRINDPLSKEFIEIKVNRLAQSSRLQDRRLEFILIRDAELNAFAAPGGIIGVNGGLFLSAPNEAEFMGVLAHELAHLSQRHFARGIAAQQQLQVPMMTALLVGIVAAAAGSPDAGMATILGSQAAAYQNMMSFSRANEQEADRVGIETLAKAGYSAQAMPDLFEILMKKYRFQQIPPEFLITHPLTESRIADTRNRAEGYPKNGVRNTLEYSLVRARIQSFFEETPGSSVRLFRSLLENNPNDEVLQYGLAISLLKNNNLSAATNILKQLLAKSPDNIFYNLAYVDLDFYQGNLADANQRIQKMLLANPNNYPITKAYVDLLMKQKDYQQANRIMERLVRTRPNDPDIWNQAVEVRGKSGDIIGVHQAQAQYLSLTGNFDTALEQLKFARQKAGNSFQQLAMIDQQAKEIRTMQETVKQFLQ
ncbi:M48 family peptidase [Entomomonas moraniae]|uniref:Putative beta-barrel assembly-enhancing protease n=1 Tax=Entomomonas moraniae TaxID=2213226 RepID=A0A3S9XBP1_9GAMM|nr:M48 family metalloprotease [Entomomonas moraniae]AZS49839.1 M48 family peptidase [Entomomonas moraniae]